MDIVPFALVCLAWWIGGWLVSRRLFRLEPSERIAVGLGVGLSAFVFLSNLLGHWLPPEWAFPLSGLLVLLAGLVTLRSQSARELREDLAGWPVLTAILVGALIFTLMGRGLALLDDRKNLSIISLMAAGDIPPHFYMNPDTLFRYHYGFQLFGASAVRLGGLFPWSAFDLTKGFAGALSVGLAYLVGKRLTHREAGGWLTAVSLLFAGGARWLMLFLPGGILAAVGKTVPLAGVSEASGETLRAILTGPWVVAGGPPVPVPFAYLGGVLEPFILGLQAGPGSLARVILLLAILLLPRQRTPSAAAVLTILFATWALAWEAWFALIVVGGLAVALRNAVWKRGESRRILWWTVVALVAGGVLSLVQGGTITEITRSVLTSGAPGGVAGGVPLVALRWPPAVVSAQLGELTLSNPMAWPVALLELGAAALAGVFVLGRSLHWARQRRFVLAILAASSVLGFVLPLFVRYTPDRDVSRFTAFSLLIWILLSVPLVVQAWRRWRRGPVRVGLAAYLVLLNVSGIVVAGSLTTAIPRGVLTEKTAPLDAGMAARIWDVLPSDAVIFDSHPWRAVVLTGRPERSSDLEYQTLPTWEALVRDPSPAALAAAGYTHAYVDAVWWRTLTAQARESFQDPCVRTIAEGEDNADNNFRRLLDISTCGP